MTKLSNSNQKYIKEKGEDTQEIFTIKIMVRGIIKIDIGQILEIGEYHSVVEYNMDKNRGTARYNQNYRCYFRRQNFSGNL